LKNKTTEFFSFQFYFPEEHDLAPSNKKINKFPSRVIKSVFYLNENGHLVLEKNGSTEVSGRTIIKITESYG
jgi:hypothetical protein